MKAMQSDQKESATANLVLLSLEERHVGVIQGRVTLPVEYKCLELTKWVIRAVTDRIF